jgi:hypothetical protein
MKPYFVGRGKTRDSMMTFDSAGRTHDSSGNALGVPLGNRFKTHDGRTTDSTGAFLLGELERLDQTLHEPLAAVTWGRDIDLREDVTIADEVSSFTTSTFGSAGGLGAGNGIGTGKAWIGKTTDQITGIGLDIAKVPNPLSLWGMEIKYTIPELESAAKLGRPIDQQKYAGMQLKHQMDIDEQVYMGDTTLSQTGLVNNASASTITNVANGASGSPLWSSKTPDEILIDVNSLITSVWTASAYAVVPDRLLLPPVQFGQISTQKVGTSGSISLLKYLEENNLLTTSGRGKLNIYPLKWLIGAGANGTIGTEGAHDRMVCYTKQKDRIRYPMTLLQRTPIQYESIYHKTTYFCRLGVVETVYNQCIGYADGL